jgi:hypothetical protein
VELKERIPESAYGRVIRKGTFERKTAEPDKRDTVLQGLFRFGIT